MPTCARNPARDSQIVPDLLNPFLLPISHAPWKRPAHVIVEETSLPGVKILTPRRFADDRGHFFESWNRERLRDAGIDADFVQDNQSYSRLANTVRGLHFQSPPHAQAKLVRCGRGRIFDVAVDIRAGSPTYGQWAGVELSAENGKQLFVPAGFLHGFATREDDCEVLYKCDAYYAPSHDGSVRFGDPEIGIDWGLTGPAILSEKDASAPMLSAIGSPFRAEGAG